MKDRVALYSPPIRNLTSYLDMVDLAAKYGIKHLETINGFELSEPDLAFAEKLRAYADEKGVDFPCVSLGINLVGDDHLQAVARAKKYADVARILGSPYLHHTIALEFQNPALIEANKETFYQRGLDAVREIYDYAASIGVRTIYEDQGYLFNGVENFKKFLKDVNRDVGVVADFGNICFVDERAEDFIPHFADRIVNAHIKDYRIVENPNREREQGELPSAKGSYLLDVLFGEGNIDMDAVFAALDATGYRGTIAMECPPLDDGNEGFERNLEFLQRYI